MGSFAPVHSEVRQPALRVLYRPGAALPCTATTHLGSPWPHPLQLPCVTQNAQVYQSELEVIEGALPADLSGAFLRNGPNPKLSVEGGYHW